MTHLDIRTRAKELSAATPEKRQIEVLRLLEEDPFTALKLIPRCIYDKAFLVDILATGVALADSSQIRYWLEAVIPRLGFVRTLRNLERLLESNPEGVQRALYWLPQLCPPEPKARVQLSALLCSAEKKGVWPLPTTERVDLDGRVTFEPWQGSREKDSS